MKNIITAIEISDRNKSIDKIVETEVVKYVKSRTVKHINKLKKSGLDYDKLKIYDEFYNDADTLEYRENVRKSQTVNNENYSVMRTFLSGLNDIDEFSADIESYNLVFESHQPKLKLVEYKDIVSKSVSKTDLLEHCKKTRIDNINERISRFSKLEYRKNYNRLFDENDPLSILLLIRDSYKLTKDVDQLEIYDKYDMFDNLAMSNILADILFTSNSNNLLNELVSNNSMISKLAKTKVISNKLLAQLLHSRSDILNHDSPIKDQITISNNKITCYANMWTVTTAQDEKQKKYENKRLYATRTLGELLFDIVNDEYANVTKDNRQQIYMTYDGTRPRSNEYYKWNGLQVIDIDLKNWKNLSKIDSLIRSIYEQLTDYHWFLWICKSSSGNGIHIYTKVTPPHHIYIKPEDNESLCKYWYMINFYTKSSIIYDIFYSRKDNFQFTDDMFLKSDNKYETGFEIENLDPSVGRITSGIRLTYDPRVLVNENFIDLPVCLGLGQTYGGYNDKAHINKILFRDTKISNKFFDELRVLIDSLKVDNSVPLDSVPNINQYVLKGYDLANVTKLPLNNIKYITRYNVCNTLAALTGEAGLPIAHEILRSKECRNETEINAFYGSALRNRKEASKVGLEILKKCGIVKYVKQELTEVLDNKYKLDLKRRIEAVLNNSENEYDIILKDDQYLSDVKGLLMTDHKKGFRNDKVNILIAAPSVGKTTVFKDISKEKRVLLVLPYISVIRNKIETDTEIMELFECFYGDKDVEKMDHGINAVTTFDKFSKTNYEKISRMFDYIVIDEAHLLFNSQYRIHATAGAIKKLNNLFYISLNDPYAAKIVLMSGTPTGETFFYRTNSNVIRVYKKIHQKKLQFQLCDNMLDSVTRMAWKIHLYLKDGYRILVPTNKGDVYSEKLMGMLQYLMSRNIKYGYYKRSNNEQEICTLINDKNTVGDYEVIFCSNYLSVGIDINDTNIKFAACYLGNYSAYEIEQFNSRVRRKGIESIYFIKTMDDKGDIDPFLLEEPNLVLRLTDEDISNYVDDREIASAKTTFIAEYDPALKQITTPGFTVMAGKIQFDKEQYELINFENKYNECFQHPLKIARELAVYGYDITVDTEFTGLDEAMQTNLKNVGTESAKDEKIRKHQLLIGTFIDLVKGNKYVSKHGLEYNDVIKWISDNIYNVVEDRDADKFVEVVFGVMADPQKCVVKSRVALEQMISPAKYLLSKYSETKCLDILNQYVSDEGILMQKHFKRAVNLLKLIEANDLNELSVPITKVIEKIYEYIDEFEMHSDYTTTYKSYINFIDNLTDKYIDDLGINIRTKYGWDKIRASVVEIFKDIAIRSGGKDSVRFSYNVLPDQDSANVLYKRSIDTLVENLFRITGDVLSNKKKSNVREKHIMLEPQNY